MTAAPTAEEFASEIDPDQYVVVVGVSASSGSPTALRWAVDEAREYGGRLIAVRAWRPPPPPASSAGRPSVFTFDAEQLYADAQDQLGRDVRSVLGPDAEVECRVVHGGRRKVLLAAARVADLLVIDAPQRTDLSSGPLFARRLVYRAGCPVVIMPPAISELPDTAVVAAGKRIGRGLLTAAGTAGRPGVRVPITSDVDGN
ncbi:universal stress protein [Nakamurella sp. GG22]